MARHIIAPSDFPEDNTAVKTITLTITEDEAYTLMAAIVNAEKESAKRMVRIRTNHDISKEKQKFLHDDESKIFSRLKDVEEKIKALIGR